MSDVMDSAHARMTEGDSRGAAELLRPEASRSNDPGLLVMMLFLECHGADFTRAKAALDRARTRRRTTRPRRARARRSVVSVRRCLAS